ncbi:MAG: tetratricopeptide repeat protein [Bacteroidetes bacterium]|nr:tetratricopeptide repeat protein [Bacteroidota bacterium]MDA1119937.1 tetratricopeptide repeat protein [Bacteroidota bacterium]
MAENLDNQKLRADNLAAIGIIHAGVNNNVLAISYYQNALKELEDTEVNQQVVSITNSIGEAYLDIDQFDSAEYYLTLAQSLLTPEMEFMNPQILFNLGESKTKQDQFEEARSLLYESIELGKQFNDLSTLINSYETIAKIELYYGQIQDALYHSALAMELAQSICVN